MDTSISRLYYQILTAIICTLSCIVTLKLDLCIYWNAYYGLNICPGWVPSFYLPLLRPTHCPLAWWETKGRGRGIWDDLGPERGGNNPKEAKPKCFLWPITQHSWQILFASTSKYKNESFINCHKIPSVIITLFWLKQIC